MHETETERHFKETAGNGVEVGIIEYGDVYYWEFTNYGSRKERAEAIDEMDSKYNFMNWK